MKCPNCGDESTYSICWYCAADIHEKDEISMDALMKLLSQRSMRESFKQYTDETDIAKYLLEHLHIYPKEAH